MTYDYGTFQNYVIATDNTSAPTIGTVTVYGNVTYFYRDGGFVYDEGGYGGYLPAERKIEEPPLEPSLPKRAISLRGVPVRR